MTYLKQVVCHAAKLPKDQSFRQVCEPVYVPDVKRFDMADVHFCIAHPAWMLGGSGRGALVHLITWTEVELSFPAASLALARMTWLPAAAFRVFHE